MQKILNKTRHCGTFSHSVDGGHLIPGSVFLFSHEGLRLK